MGWWGVPHSEERWKVLPHVALPGAFTGSRKNPATLTNVSPPPPPFYQWMMVSEK